MGYIMNGARVDRTRFALRDAPPFPAVGDLRTREVSVDGARLRIAERGAGDTTFVVVPDPPNVIEHHEAMFAQLAEGGRVIGLELPGFGFSSIPHGFTFSAEANAAVVLRALKQLDVRGAILIFPCVAGLAALEAARIDPETIAGIVVCQLPSFDDVLSWTRRVDFKGLVATPIVGQLLVRATRRRLARAWYDAALPQGVDREPYLTAALRAYDRGADYCLASALQAVQRTPAPSKAVEVPVLSVWGALDRTHRRSDPAALATLIPQFELQVFHDAGHFPDLEQPERFADRVLHFANRIH